MLFPERVGHPESAGVPLHTWGNHHEKDHFAQLNTSAVGGVDSGAVW